jgi:hypothetical protein
MQRLRTGGEAKDEVQQLQGKHRDGHMVGRDHRGCRTRPSRTRRPDRIPVEEKSDEEARRGKERRVAAWQRNLILMVLLAGWLMTEVGANDPKMVLLKRHEGGLSIATTVVMEMARKIIKEGEATMKDAKEWKKSARRRRHWYVHGGRWLCMASQLQETIHMYIMTKGKCRCCEEKEK